MEQEIIIGEHAVRLVGHPLGDYLSLTDLAKMVNEDTSRVIGKWIELLRTIDFLHTWEKNYNPKYNETGFAEIRMAAGVPNFFLSPKQWIERTNAIGIESKAGRHGGGTYAHHLIALEFCSTMDPEFRFKVFKEYTELRKHQAENWLKSHQFFLQKIEDNALENNRLAMVMQEEAKNLGKP